MRNESLRKALITREEGCLRIYLISFFFSIDSATRNNFLKRLHSYDAGKGSIGYIIIYVIIRKAK